MRIYTDHNGVAVNAIHTLGDGTNVEGHVYDILTGSHVHTLSFQFGPVKDNGVNGLTNEALLAVLSHRLTFMNSKFPCNENVQAIARIEEALAFLEQRTANRLQRGVEGQNLE